MIPRKDDEYSKFANYMSRFRYKCKCGHTVYLSKAHPKRLCDWCKNMVYLDKQEEFKDKLKSKLKK